MTGAVRHGLTTIPAQGIPPAEVDEPNLLAALVWSAARDPGLADRMLVSISQLADLKPSRQTLEVLILRRGTTRGPGEMAKTSTLASC